MKNHEIKDRIRAIQQREKERLILEAETQQKEIKRLIAKIEQFNVE